MLPQRSPTPLIVPWAWSAPARTAASALATASEASLWVWMPTSGETRRFTAATASAMSSGMLPPLVSHRQRTDAPASSAARSVWIAY